MKKKDKFWKGFIIKDFKKLYHPYLKTMQEKEKRVDWREYISHTSNWKSTEKSMFSFPQKKTK